MLDTNPARPLFEIPPAYKNSLRQVNNFEVTFAPGLNHGQEMAAIFAHILAKISSGEFTSETGMPSSKQAIAQMGLPGKVLLPAHTRALVHHKIIPQKDSGQGQLNAHRDHTPLLPGAEAEISASPYLRWLAANAHALSSITDERSPLNEVEYAVLEMIAGRKYQHEAGFRNGALLSPRELQDRAIQEAEYQNTPLILRISRHSGYCRLAVKKYTDLKLIKVAGPTRKQLTYTRLPNAMARAEQLLQQFDNAREQAAQRAAQQSAMGDGNAIDPGPQARDLDLDLDLQSEINASLRENHVQRFPNQIQEDNLPRDFYWYSPPSDGNCFFHALSRRFPHLGNHLEIRESVATAGLHNQNMNLQFRRDLAAAVRQPGEYTGAADSAIQVAAEAFGIHIQVVVENGSLRKFGPQNGVNEMILARNQDHFFLMEQIPTENMDRVLDDEIPRSESDSVDAQPQSKRDAAGVDKLTAESPAKRHRPDRKEQMSTEADMAGVFDDEISTDSDSVGARP